MRNGPLRRRRSFHLERWPRRSPADPALGGNIGYAKLPPGATLPLHWHSAAEYTVLISGKVQFIVDGKPYDLEPGGYVVIPAKTNHLAKCAPGAECILLTRRGGPIDYTG